MRELVVDEELLLDLLNSAPVVEGQVRDEFAEDADASVWLRERGGSGDATEVESARRARDALQDVVRGESGPEVLAPLLARVRQRPEPTLDGVRWHLEVPDSERLAARAVLAWAELASSLPGRLKPCGNDECRLFFVDRSRAGTGRWCSMAVCGNRMKARRHHERSRAR